MRSPEKMAVIQIELTNACINRCGNCTRLCGHHKKPFYMDFSTFKRAIHSLKGFTGFAGIMGGEPTLHPHFEKFILYYKDNWGTGNNYRALKKPAPTFLAYCNSSVFMMEHSNQRGLWSSLSKKYLEHFELIQDTFSYQCLNDHANASHHSPLLIDRSELGISDADWFPMRDACWVQNQWSASITPKGAFFCEVAATMDMTLNGPGGWEIEPGWWKRKPEDFKEQLHWCEICSAAIPLKSRLASSGIDDISPNWAKRLEGIQSPKYKKEQYELYNLSSTLCSEEQNKEEKFSPYIDSHDERINIGELFYPQNVTVLLNIADHGNISLNHPLCQQILEKFPVQGIIASAHLSFDNTCNLPLFNPESFHISQVEKVCTNLDWLLILHPYEQADNLLDFIKTHVFNPGCLYRHSLSYKPQDYKALFTNKKAFSLRNCYSLNQWYESYPATKHVEL